MHPKLRSSRSVAILIFLISISASSFYALTLFGFFDPNHYDLHPDYYGIIAKNLITGKGYIIQEGGQPVVWRPPFYSLFLATIYVVFGTTHFPVIVAQILLISLTSVLVFYLMQKIFNRGLGITTAIIWSFYPLINYYSIRELPTVLFTFVFLIFLLLFIEFDRVPGKRNVFLLGIVQGILILIKLVFKGFPFLFIMYMLFRSLKTSCHLTANRNSVSDTSIKPTENRPRTNRVTSIWTDSLLKRFVPNLLFFIVGLSIVLMPWMVRNYYVTDRFPVIGVGGGFTLWFGNNVDYDGLDYDQLSPEKERELKNKVKKIVGEGSGVDFANDKKLYSEAIQNFKRYPQKSLWLMVKKSFRLWFSVYTKKMLKYQLLVFLIQIVILVPALLGLATLLRKRRIIWPLILPLIYFQLAYTLYTATARYCVPLMPIAIGFGVYGVTNFFKRLSISKQRSMMFGDVSNYLQHPLDKF